MNEKIKKASEFGDCIRCSRVPAIVKLGDDPLCLKCFDERMGNIGSVLRTCVDAYRRARGAKP